MSSPFIFDVTKLLAASSTVELKAQTGPSPATIGAGMIAIPEGREVTVQATLSPLGEGILVDAEVSAVLDGQCVRCLAELHPEKTFHITSVFSDSDTFITTDPNEDDAEDAEIEEFVGAVIDGQIDLLAVVTDEVGLNLPFNPVCAGGCLNDETGVPAPDGVSGEDEANLLDPRWAGLEKFL
ncbi:YceD family protein [Corynebacterium caspium]|uniref:YceD family protein n=1 Tax=Corynebacterium caspium TaxID=234828 RepID=UPI00036A0F42|nr:YceD family protein [Corynebacterium caspium]WKD59043.1 hypothetical protein CCASP_03195 [Corynebacterium caspium DSM 44850]